MIHTTSPNKGSAASVRQTGDKEAAIGPGPHAIDNFWPDLISTKDKSWEPGHQPLWVKAKNCEPLLSTRFTHIVRVRCQVRPREFSSPNLAVRHSNRVSSKVDGERIDQSLQNEGQIFVFPTHLELLCLYQTYQGYRWGLDTQ